MGDDRTAMPLLEVRGLTKVFGQLKACDSIDLVVGNVLLALGMQMLSPTQVSMPFKLLLFVAIDGWGLLSEALVSGYH